MKIIKKMLVLGLFLGIAGAVTTAAILIKLSSNLPEIIGVHDYKPRLVSEVYDRNQKKIGEFFREKRIITPYEKIPKKLIDAFVAAEDSSFYNHQGINFKAIMRAMWANIKAGRKAQGASTITQQVARSLLLSSEKTYIRKIREMILAYRMETHLTKAEIIYLYLNQIYFGQGAYGIAAAAETYFRKSLDQLELEEMAILAGLPQAPSRYSPVRNPKSAKARQKYVLKRMAEESYIKIEEANAAVAKEVKVYKRENYKQIAPYYLETIRQLLVEELGAKTVLDQGIKVYTGVDLDMQVAAQKSLAEGLRGLDKRQGYRGPKSRLETPEEIAIFLAKSRLDLIKKKYEYKIILPDGTNPPLPEIAVRELPDLEVEPEKKQINVPEYVSIGQIVDGVVIDVDDEWGLVRVRFAESIGIIDFQSMKWAREPNPDVRSHYFQIKKPSEALEKGDVIEVRVVGQRFYSSEVEKRVNRQKRKVKNKEEYERPEAITGFGHWARLKLEQEPVAEASLVSFDQETSEVLAMVGGYDFNRSEFNRALQSARQTGSSFKAIVYAAAMDLKYTPATLITDAPIVYEEELPPEENALEADIVATSDEKVEKRIKRWKPNNHSNRFGGEILFRNALIRSLNVPTVKILQDIGIEWVADYARRLGIFSPLNMDYTLGLGSSGVTLYELTKVFAQFGRLGHRIRPLLIHQVVSQKGETLMDEISLDYRFRQEMTQYEAEFEERRQTYLKMKELAEQENEMQKEEAEFANAEITPEQEEKQAKESSEFKGVPHLFFDDEDQMMKPQTAYLITSLLEGAVHERRGTGGMARALGRPVAGKTGTTNGYYDGWFIGYTPQISTGVWVGFDQERSLGVGEVGGKNALPIWLGFMQSAHKGLPIKAFPVPADIIFANIDNESGKIASANTKNYVRQAFLDGTEPTESSDPSFSEDETDFYKQDLSE